MTPLSSSTDPDLSPSLTSMVSVSSNSPDSAGVTNPPDSAATNPPDSARVVNPVAAALHAGAEDKDVSWTRRFMGALPWSALAATMIVSLRVLTVAHLNLPTALQLVSLTDTAKVLLGLAVLFFEPFLIVVALYVHLVCSETLHDVIKAARSKMPFEVSNRSIFFAFMWPLVVVMAFAFFATRGGLLILIGVALWTFQRAWIDSKPSDPASSPGTRPKPSLAFRLTLIIAGMILMGVGFAMVALDDTPWLPPEQIVLVNGSVMVGYVVAESNSELTVLRDSDRSIITVSASQVRSQTLCQIGAPSGSGDWFVRLDWGTGPKLPTCASGR